MKKSKILSTFIVVSLLISVMFCNVYASDQNMNFNQISKEQLMKLTNAGVAKEDISSLCQQIEVYKPKDTQVDNYIKGLIENKTSKSAAKQKEIKYEKTKNGDTKTPYGVIPYQDIALKWDGASSLKAVSGLSSRVNAGDQTGVYYVINSTGGHNQLTSYATLPNLSNVNSIDRPYQMMGMSSTNGSNSMYGDIGLVYFPESRQWKGCYNVVENGSRSEKYNFSFNGKSNIYFHLQMYTNKAVLIIRDASSWAEVSRIEYTFKTKCVPSNFSTTKLSKQVTLAQHIQGGKLNIATRTEMKNAQFSQSWLYTPSNNHSFGPSYCSEAYRQGPTNAAYQKVNATYNAWSSDNVNIAFK